VKNGSIVFCNRRFIHQTARVTSAFGMPVTRAIRAVSQKTTAQYKRNERAASGDVMKWNLVSAWLLQ
jgi:hypothetical protein